MRLLPIRIGVLVLFVTMISVIYLAGASETTDWEDWEAYSDTDTDFTTSIWKNQGTDTCDWIADSAGTGSSNTGPGCDSTTGYDHTIGDTSGMYVYLETSSGYCLNDGENALLNFTQVLDGSTYSYNISFWLHMYGSVMGELYLYGYNSSGKTTIWSQEGNNIASCEDPYQYVEVDLSAFEDSFYLEFDGVSGGNYYSDIAIDDINVSNITRASDGDPPIITDAQFNDTEINQNDAVLFKVNVTDESGVDQVNATFKYPDTSEVNVTCSEEFESQDPYHAGDQESEEQQVLAGAGGGSPTTYYDSFEGSHSHQDPVDTNPSTYWSDGGGDIPFWYGACYTTSSTTGAGVAADTSCADGSWFVFTETSATPGPSNSAYYLDSTPFYLNSGDNLTVDFYWHMYGVDQDFDYARLMINTSGGWEELWRLDAVSHGNYGSGDPWDNAFIWNDTYTGWHRLRLHVQIIATYQGDFCFDDVNITIFPSAGGLDDDGNSSWVVYDSIGGSDFDDITSIEIDTLISYSDLTGSQSAGNEWADLQVGVYNGASYDIENYCGVYGERGASANSTDANCSFTITDPTILTAWETASDRKVEIRGIYFDSESGNDDEINWTDVVVTVNYQNATGYYRYEWTDTSSTGQYNVTWVWANDTLNNINYTSISDVGFVVSTGDTGPPKWYDNTTNGTEAGTWIEHSVNWTDDVGLSGYIFSFCNGTWNGESCAGGAETIQLNAPDTENHDDVFAQEAWPDSNYGSTTSISFGADGGDDRFDDWIRFNISEVPENYNIDGAVLALYTYLNFMEGGDSETISVYELDNYTWVEESITWNDRPTGDIQDLINETTITDATSGWVFFDVTSWVSETYESGKLNTSFYMNMTNNDLGDADGWYAYSKEHTATRPYLNITYSAGGWVNDSWVAMTGDMDYSNETKFVNIDPGSNIAWYISANDTSDSWNSTDIFNYTTTSGDVTPPNVDFISPTAVNGTESENKTYIVWNISVSEDIGDCKIEINGTNQTGTQVDAGSDSYCYYNETGLVGNVTRCALGHASDGLDNWNTTPTYICRNTNEQQPSDTVEISDCGTLAQTGKTYLLTADITNTDENQCMYISGNSITLDCQGHIIDGNGTVEQAIYIYRGSPQTTSITVKNCEVYDFVGCIEIINADSNTIYNTTLYDCGSGGSGLRFEDSDSNNITDTTVTKDNSATSASNGIILVDSYQNEFNNITVKYAVANGIYSYSNSNYNRFTDSIISDNWHYDINILPPSAAGCGTNFTNVNGTGGYPILYYNTSVTIEDIQVAAISLCNADNSVLRNISLQGWGETNSYRNTIDLYYTDYTNLTEITIDRGYKGIELQQSDWNKINDSNFTRMRYADIYIGGSHNNTIHDNNLTYNDVNTGSYESIAITLDLDSEDNLIYNNLMYDGEALADTKALRYQGTLRYNSWNTTEQSGTRIYSAGNNIGGNYYTNSSAGEYSDICTDSDSDGFCDSPFDLETHTSCTIGVDCGNDVDYLPYSDQFGVDTCTYESGNWVIDCSDYCTTTIDVDLGGNDIILTGDGEWLITSEVSNVDELIKYSLGCKIIIYPPSGTIW
jgi:hypothetical protein